MSENPKTQQACEAAGGTWDAATNSCKMPSMDSKPVTDAALMRENEMLKAQLRVREDQLKQAIQIANKANDLQAARDAAEREDLITRIIADSNNKWSKDELSSKSRDDLLLIKTAVSKEMDHTFASVAAYQAEQDRKTKPLLTAGAWDSKTQTWKGGI